jgi:hypothetical protein
MKLLTIVVVFLMTLTSCGQTVKSDNQQSPYKLTSKEALVVYQTMTSEICNCTSVTMKNNKPSTTLDSCYKIVLAKFTDTLKNSWLRPFNFGWTTQVIKRNTTLSV